MTVGQERR